MDGSTRIAAGIIVGALIIAISYVGYREFARQRNLVQVASALEAMSTQARRASQQWEAQRLADQRTRNEAAQKRERKVYASRVLSDNQRCIGNVVIAVDGSSYSQPLRHGRPVTCHGRMADRPFR